MPRVSAVDADVDYELAVQEIELVQGDRHDRAMRKPGRHVQGEALQLNTRTGALTDVANRPDALTQSATVGTGTDGRQRHGNVPAQGRFSPAEA